MRLLLLGIPAMAISRCIFMALSSGGLVPLPAGPEEGDFLRAMIGTILGLEGGGRLAMVAKERFLRTSSGNGSFVGLPYFFYLAGVRGV